MSKSPDTSVLDLVIDQCQQIIESTQKCPRCGNSPDPDLLFKARDQLMKAYALKTKKAPGSMGAQFTMGDDDDD